MSDTQQPGPGSIAWMDLIVADADRIREFYSQVVGWSADPVDMGDYNDYGMNTPEGQTVAGICHALGPNADLPAQWMIYIVVDDVQAAAASCIELGGEVLMEPKSSKGSCFCVIRDPASAVCALYQTGKAPLG